MTGIILNWQKIISISMFTKYWLSSTFCQVFQRRVDGSEDFYLGWDSYKEGFGNNSHEFWLGNDKLHYLTKQKTYEIRIDLVNRYGAPYYAKFDLFRINDESDNYRLSDVGSYSGTAGWCICIAFLTFFSICSRESHGRLNKLIVMHEYIPVYQYRYLEWGWVYIFGIWCAR